MRILQVYKTYLPDSFTGIERVIFEIAEGTAPLGAEHRVLAVSATPTDQPVQVGTHKVYRARQDLLIASTSFSLSAFGIYRDLWDWADLVHFHYPWPMMDLLHLSKGRRDGKPTIVTYHSDIVRQRALGRLYRPLGRWFLSSADRIVATSPNYARTSSVLTRYAAKVVTIPIGLADRAPPTQAKLGMWRRRFPSPFFLFVGSGRYYKGLPYLLEAARLTGLPVVVVGASMTMPTEAIPPNVSMLGEVGDEDKDALLQLSTALVLPSHLRSEAYGVVLVEACRAGRPMISCEIGTGTSFVNEDGCTGLVVPPGQPQPLADAMSRLRHDPSLAARMGEAARRRYERELSGDRMSAAYAALYSELLYSGRRAEDGVSGRR